MKNEIENDKDIAMRISNIWIGKKDIENYSRELGGTEYIHMALLIMSNYNKFKTSKFNLKDILYWYDLDMRSVKGKLKLLERMQDKGCIKFKYPVRDMIVVDYLDDIFYPEKNFTLITKNEIETVINNNVKKNRDISKNEKRITGISNHNLLSVYLTIKSYMNITNKEYIAYPSEERIIEHLGISPKSVCACIVELKRLKLLSYINRGYNKATKRNLGNVYTLYSDDAEQRLEDYIRNEFQQTL